MGKIVVIHQPDFLPYLGFFHRLLQADLWVILDNVQFVHKGSGWQHRDKIKTPAGEKWITISVQKPKLGTPIQEVILSKDVDWKNNHLNLIRQNYNKAEFFNEIFPCIQELYRFDCFKMVDFNLKSIKLLLSLFDIKIEYVMASTLGGRGKNNELLSDILKKVGATTYLSGVGAKDYFKQEPFDKAGIDVVWQKFVHPVYPQLFGEFIPYLSSIDLLFNCGIKESREILRRC
ncbi:MAG: WbqC family protein [Candidatus Omnitrophota bacterium]|nr:WbqC family protein [Candidatus Omnitrophota bacterium]